nr:2'-5' RNA ligase family protein [Sphingomonas sp.]
MAGALIITAEIGPQDYAWLEQLRRTHYPAERNQVPAHLTMFRALPPSAEGEVRSRLARITPEGSPRASIQGLMDLGGGVAFRVASPDLERIRNELAEDLRGLLSAQDAVGWRPHITIQNKVSPREARALLAKLERDFRPRPLAVSGLGLHRYLGGPWDKLSIYSFRGR